MLVFYREMRDSGFDRVVGQFTATNYARHAACAKADDTSKQTGSKLVVFACFTSRLVATAE